MVPRDPREPAAGHARGEADQPLILPRRSSADEQEEVEDALVVAERLEEADVQEAAGEGEAGSRGERALGSSRAGSDVG